MSTPEPKSLGPIPHSHNDRGVLKMMLATLILMLGAAAVAVPTPAAAGVVFSAVSGWLTA